MSSKLIAGNATNGSSLSADTTGILEIQTGSTPTTAITVDASQNVTLNNVIPSGSTVPANGMFLPTTNSVGFSTSSTERMRIDSSGNLLVGTTTNGLGLLSGFNITQASGQSYCAVGHVSGTAAGQPWMAFSYNGTPIGSITQSGTTATSFNTSSDYRLKENIAPMTGALDKVSALKPVTYNWKADGSDGQGFIAHELQAVVPDCVTGEKDAVDAKGNPVYQGIDTSFLVATLTAAIQEQQAMIEELKIKVATLEAK